MPSASGRVSNGLAAARGDDRRCNGTGRAAVSITEMSPPAHRNPYPGPSSHAGPVATEPSGRHARPNPYPGPPSYAGPVDAEPPGHRARQSPYSGPPPDGEPVVTDPTGRRARLHLYPGPPARARPRPFGYGPARPPARTRPVFADSSGRRARRMRLVGMCVGGALVACLIVMAVGLLGGPGATFIPWDGHHGSGSADTASAGRARTAGPGSAPAIMPASGRSGATRGGSSSPSASPSVSPSAAPSPSPAVTNRAGKKPPGLNRTPMPSHGT